MNIKQYRKEIERLTDEAKSSFELDVDYKTKRLEEKVDQVKEDALRALEAAEEAANFNLKDVLEGRFIYKSSLKVYGGSSSYSIEAKESYLKLTRVPDGDYDALVILTPKSK